MKSFQWKWIFTGSKTCCTILRPFRFAMAAIWNPKWPSKYKNPQIWAKFCTTIDMIVKNWALIISCYVLTLFFIHTTSTCIVRLGDMYSALRYSNQCLFHYLYLPASTFCNVLGSSSAFAWIQISHLNNPSVTSLKIQASFFSGSHAMSSAKWSWYFTTILEYIKWFLVEKIRFFSEAETFIYPFYCLFYLDYVYITWCQPIWLWTCSYHE